MDTVTVLRGQTIGKGFIPPEFLPEGKDEYYLRDMQLGQPDTPWRSLRAGEIEELIKNGNTCGDWGDILVTDRFEPGRVKNNQFFGLIRIGKMEPVILEHHDLQVPTGITSSRIIACDIGPNSAVHNVRYLARFIIGGRSILLNIDEMHTTNHAKFGNGIIKDGEDEKVRVWLDLVNETGCRRVMPFEEMTPADAYIWMRYRDDTKLQTALGTMTQGMFDTRRGFYGEVGQQCVIKNTRIIKDVRIGGHCYIKGANKLKNLTIRSSEKEPTQIGEGVEMVNGIVGYGCHIFYGCKAVRFIMGNNAHLKYGARLLNSFLGDNSTVSCCEMLNNLIFPAHEQHHNNSFLIASLVMGQSNLAAGATIGSNHNSRSNDNEILAGRGFWPGLCTSVKHSCRFASFTLLSKADYPAELDIPLPFSLLNNDTSGNTLQVMPAFWWTHNMYALARNSWKFQARDTRVTKVQNIEFDSLAPDTIEEVLSARRLLEIWTAKAALRRDRSGTDGKTGDELADIGKSLLSGDAEKWNNLEVRGENMEKSSRPVVILKPREAYAAYEQMLVFYAVKNCIAYMVDHPQADLKSMCRALAGPRTKEWINLGGQLVGAADVNHLLNDIKSGGLKTWHDIHARYGLLWSAYAQAKQAHAFAVLAEFTGTPSPTDWDSLLDRAAVIQQYICDQVYLSRKKDYDNPFRQATFRNREEMTAAIGTVEDNSFIRQIRKETEGFRALVETVRARG